MLLSLSSPPSMISWTISHLCSTASVRLLRRTAISSLVFSATPFNESSTELFEDNSWWSHEIKPARNSLHVLQTEVKLTNIHEAFRCQFWQSEYKIKSRSRYYSYNDPDYLIAQSTHQMHSRVSCKRNENYDRCAKWSPSMCRF